MRSFCMVVLAAAIGLVPKIAAPALAHDGGSTESEKMLRIEITVPATRADVWKAFSTSEGLSSWLAPNAVVELRPGGEWMVHTPTSSAGGTIVSFVPEKEIVSSALAPEEFPNVRAQRTTARFELEDRGTGTLVRLSQTGWKDGAEWDRAYEYLTAGKVEVMAALHKRFVSEPLEWSKP